MMRELVVCLMGLMILAMGAPAPEGSGESPPYDMEVVESIECESVPDWDDSVFGELNGGEGEIAMGEVKSGSFLDRAGFHRYTKVFGIPIVASDSVGSVALGRAAASLYSLLDNDEDGVVDNADWVEGLLKYRVIFGYFSSGAESEEFWKNAEKSSVYKKFMEQYLCNMHFVEIWQTDLSQLFYTSMAERQALIEAGTLDAESPNILKRCGAATTEKFDLSLWYYLFSFYYYGAIDQMPKDKLTMAENTLKFVQDSRGFNPHYATDAEMTLADFLAWATLTNMGAIECHCTQTAIQNHWRPCRKSDLPTPLVEFLDSVKTIPKNLPNPNYPNPREKLPEPQPEPIPEE